MQTYAETIREDVWGKLNKIFLEATGGKDNILSEEIHKVLVNTLKITDQSEIDYVLKNLFRLDTDNNGKIDFPEFVVPVYNLGQLPAEATLRRAGPAASPQEARRHQARRREEAHLGGVRRTARRLLQLPRREGGSG